MVHDIVLRFCDDDVSLFLFFFVKIRLQKIKQKKNAMKHDMKTKHVCVLFLLKKI